MISIIKEPKILTKEKRRSSIIQKIKLKQKKIKEQIVDSKQKIPLIIEKRQKHVER